MQCNPIFPTFMVLDSSQQKVAKIQGPWITSACCGDIIFDIFDKDGTTKMGFVSKNWTGAMREYFTNVDNFSLVFPMDLDVKVKAVFLAAVILIVSIKH
ncbi:hypothetical protein HPB48_011136 [Haemaphysalis longicornis]|uniref:Phospholipid scramblase n=1 Tax=Haemaphysalis longicornis TaxID=44386 RepID=A0A9J6GHV9_HAELO|nr:hypothetical protein HPB48_011136 [Haemaphysalis longicornis]